MIVIIYEDFYLLQLQCDVSEQYKFMLFWMWIVLIVVMFVVVLFWLCYLNQEDVVLVLVGECMLFVFEQVLVVDVQQFVVCQVVVVGNQCKVIFVVCNCEVCLLVGNSKLIYFVVVLCNGVQGRVIVSLNVDVRGQVINVVIVLCSGECSCDLDCVVLSVVQNWKFQLVMYEGCVVVSVVWVLVDFCIGQC